MNLRRRDGLGRFLDEAGLTGVGVLVGAGDCTFAATVLASWPGRELVLVDPWQHPARLDAATRLARADSRVRLCRDATPSAARWFGDGTLDFACLDADPAFLTVSADLAAWYPKVKPGGVLAGHADRDGLADGRLFGVRTAVDRFAHALGTAAVFTPDDPPIPGWYVRKPVGPPPAPDRITVLTAYDSGLAAVGEITRANKAAYCDRHGYRFVCRTDGFDVSRPPSWSKVRFLLDELPRADWVFWSDADALVMESSVPLTRFVQDGVEYASGELVFRARSGASSASATRRVGRAGGVGQDGCQRSGSRSDGSASGGRAGRRVSTSRRYAHGSRP